MPAIAVNGGHVNRAEEFYSKYSKDQVYFIIGGTQPWTTKDSNGNEKATDPAVEDYKLKDIIGLVRVDKCRLVIPVEGQETDGDISHGNKYWRPVISTKYFKVGQVDEDKVHIYLGGDGLESLKSGDKIRIDNEYEGVITAIEESRITLNEKVPDSVGGGSDAVVGALAEGAKHVYITCTLGSDFPTQAKDGTALSYRQVGICTGVEAADSAVSDYLLNKNYKSGDNAENDYTSLGVLEILDNRSAITRSADMTETLSIVVQF